MESYYFRFMTDGYYAFIVIIIILVVAAVATCTITIYYNNKHYKIIAKRRTMEIDCADLIRSLREDNNVK